MTYRKTALREQQDIDWYLRDQRTKKWLVQCVVCQRIGYKHDAPSRFFGRIQIVKYFDPLPLDENGICPSCRGAIDISLE